MADGLWRRVEFSQAVLYRARKGLEGTVVDTAGKGAPDNERVLAEEGG